MENPVAISPFIVERSKVVDRGRLEEGRQRTANVIAESIINQVNPNLAAHWIPGMKYLEIRFYNKYASDDVRKIIVSEFANAGWKVDFDGDSLRISAGNTLESIPMPMSQEEEWLRKQHEAEEDEEDGN